jgi:hypothetical protein
LAWQPTQVVGSPLNVDPLWHFWQEMPTCAPVSLNTVRLWSNEAGSHRLVEWHVPQADPKAPVCEAGFLWQAAHEVGALA